MLPIGDVTPMSKNGGHPGVLLTVPIYDYLGGRHRTWLDQVRGQSGPDTSLRALDQIDPKIRRDEEIRSAQDLRTWVRRHAGSLPPPASQTGIYLRGGKEERMEQEHLRWLGLAIAVATVCGVFFMLLRRRPEEGTSTDGRMRPNAEAPPPRTEVRKLRFAMVVPVAKLRELGSDPGQASDILTRSTYWWVGSESAWGSVPSELDASALGDGASDDDFALVAFDVERFHGSVPTSRPEGAQAIRKARTDGCLERACVLLVRKPASLEAAGFRR